MNRRKLLQASIALPLTSGILGCSTEAPVDIGLHPWPGYDPLLLAQHFGWFGSAVNLHEGKSASDSIEGLQRGLLNAACLTLDEVIGVRAEGIALTVILVTNESVGADAVLARPSITHITDLRGQRIGVETQSVGSIVLQKTSSAAGLTLSDVEVVNQPVDQHLRLWDEGKIDAAITYPPFSVALERAGANRIYDSRYFPHTIFDVIAVRTDRIARIGASLNTLVAGYLRALDHLRVNREDAHRRIAAWRGSSFEDTEASFRGMHLPSGDENRRLLAPHGNLMAAAQHLGQIMHDNGRLQVRPSLDKLVSDDFLPAKD